MSTTALLVDLLIIGIQTATWITCLVLTLYGINWIEPAKLKGWEVTIGVLLLSLVYPLGVFMDNLADDLLSGWRKRIRKRHLPNDTRTVLELLMTAKDDKLSAYYDYLRSRIRISRSTALNYLLITILSPIYVVVRHGGVIELPVLSICVTLLVFSALVAGLALYTWVRLMDSFYFKMKEGYEIVDRLCSKNTVSKNLAMSNIDGFDKAVQSNNPQA